MNLADMLGYADIHVLSRIADNYNCECSTHSKNELIQSILTTVSRKDVFEQQIVDLSMEDIRFLNSLLFDPRNCFSLEELIARVQQSKFEKQENEQWNPRDMISKFKQRGWLFNGFSLDTRYLFQLPADLKKRFSDVLGSRFAEQLVRTGEPDMYRDEQKLIVDDISQTLHFIAHNDALVTAEGTMYKRNLQQLLDRLSVKEDQPIKTAWRFGYGRKFRDYPNRFSLIYDYCYFQDLIVENGQALSLTEKGREKVLSGAKEDLLEVYRFWLRLYKNPIPNLQAIVHWTCKLAPDWVTYESLRQIISPLIKSFYYDNADSILESRVIQMMMHLGLIRIGEHSEFGKVVKMSKLGSSVVQGTYVEENDKVLFKLVPEE
jgi:hypothetical protein